MSGGNRVDSLNAQEKERALSNRLKGVTLQERYAANGSFGEADDCPVPDTISNTLNCCEASAEKTLSELRSVAE